MSKVPKYIEFDPDGDVTLILREQHEGEGKLSRDSFKQYSQS
jgi:hypothetical protein